MAGGEFMKQENWYFIAPFIALLLSTFIYHSFIYSFQHYDHEALRLSNILNLYPTIPEGSVLFFGESQVREDIDCLLIEEFSNSPTACFNLGIAGILPVQLALQKDLIIGAKPKKVVLGVSALFFDETLNKNDDFFMVMNGQPKIKSDHFIEKRLLENEKKLLSMNWFENDLYRRKFILPFYLAVLRQIISPQPSAPSAINNFKNPRLFTYNQSSLDLAAKLQNPAISSIFWFENSSQRQRETLIYLISRLRGAQIEVIIVKMPLHPLVDEILSRESQDLFNAYLQKLSEQFNLTVINIETNFSEEYFTDLTHLNSRGAELLAQKIAGGEYHII